MSPGRRYPAHRHPIAPTGDPTITFVTVCTKDRRPVLATSLAHELILDAWRASTHWLVGRYTILPDHIHLFCAPATIPPTSLSRWVGHWKNHVARRWPPPRPASPLWQRDFWDTDLAADSSSYATKWDYVRTNPVRHGLVATPEDWPFHGELALL